MSVPSLPMPKEASSDGDDVPVHDYQVVERADWLRRRICLPMNFSIAMINFK